MSETPTNSNERDRDIERLKSEAMYLSGVALADGKDLRGLAIKPGTYNQNQGVIVFAIGEEKYAIPASSYSDSLINQAGLLKDGSIGVPHLNDADVWGPPERRKHMGSFIEWERLVKNHR